MKLTDVLTHNPEVMSGATVFKGTRVPLSALIENLAHGVSIDEFLEDFPTVDRGQAVATLEQLGDIARDRVNEIREKATVSNTERITRALDAAVTKAAHRFAVWTGGKTLWSSGAEFLLSAFAAVEIGDEFLGDCRIDIRPEFKISDLVLWDIVAPESVRNGRIDLAVRLADTNEVFLIEFKRYLSRGSTASDFDRLAILVASNPARCKGFLVGPMYQQAAAIGNWPEHFEHHLERPRGVHQSVSFIRQPSTFVDSPFDDGGGHTQDAVAAVVVEVRAKGHTSLAAAS